MKSIRLLSLALLAVCFLLPVAASAQTAQDGFRYLDNERTGQARAVFTQLAGSQPTPENLYNMGYFLLSQGQPDSARTYFERGVAADAKSGLNHVGLGEVEIAKGNLAGAKEHFDQARKVTKNRNSEVFHRIGAAYFRYPTKDTKLALENLEKAKSLDSKNAGVYYTLGDLHLSLRDAGKATQSYESAIYFDPTMAKAHLRAGDLFMLAKDYTQALRKYQDAIAADPSYEPAYREIADLYFRGRQYANAATYYKQYMDLVGNDPDRQFVYAGYLYLDKKYPETITVLTPLAAANFSNPVVHRLLAYSAYETQDYNMGVEQIQTFMQKAKPEEVITQDHDYFARLQLAAGKDTLAAIDAFRRVIDADSSRWDLHRDIANLYFTMRQYDKTAAEYEAMAAKGMELSAQDIFNQGKGYYFSQQYEKADEAFGKLTEIASQSNLGWLWRARANVRLDPESTQGLAKPYYEKYIEMTTETDKYTRELVDANFYLASYNYFVKEDKQASRPFLEAVLALDPEHQNAKILMDSLAQAN